MAKNSARVLPSRGKWRIIISGRNRASAVVQDRSEAIERAKAVFGLVYVFGRDGRIEERIAS